VAGSRIEIDGPGEEGGRGGNVRIQRTVKEAVGGRGKETDFRYPAPAGDQRNCITLVVGPTGENKNDKGKFKNRGEKGQA